MADEESQEKWTRILEIQTGVLSEEEKKYTGVNITYNLTKTINDSVKKHNNNNIAIIPEGPYVIPVY